MCVNVPTHAQEYTHNPIAFIPTNQFLQNVMPFMVKPVTFWKHPNVTFTFIFIKAFPEQQINQELVSVWKIKSGYHVH